MHDVFSFFSHLRNLWGCNSYLGEISGILKIMASLKNKQIFFFFFKLELLALIFPVNPADFLVFLFEWNTESVAFNLLCPHALMFP